MSCHVHHCPSVHPPSPTKTTNKQKRQSFAGGLLITCLIPHLKTLAAASSGVVAPYPGIIKHQLVPVASQSLFYFVGCKETALMY